MSNGKWTELQTDAEKAVLKLSVACEDPKKHCLGRVAEGAEFIQF